MVKERSQFICQQCGYVSVKQMGRCPGCGEWGSLVEEVQSSKPKVKSLAGEGIRLLKISEIKKRKLARVKTGIGEIDRVLGGGPPTGRPGLVPGSVVLLAGEPGVGKSTLLSQLLVNLGGVYVTGEESPEQVKMRIERLKTSERKKGEDFYILPETRVEVVIEEIKKLRNEEIKGLRTKDKKSPNISISQSRQTRSQYLSILVVDSIQTMTTEDLTGTAGSVGQVRESANKLLKLAKTANLPMFLIGHVTKEGVIAGPKVLEHLVDTVLYIEGDRQHDFRLLRAVKNRFGPTDEVGVFKMSEKGMEEIHDPSGIFLQERVKNVPGSVVVPTLEGNRPILVEIQALVSPTSLKYPRRISSGIDPRLLTLLGAVIQKQLRMPLYQFDLYLNVAGGIKVTEPGVGLGVCLAIISSVKNKPMPEGAAAIGEVGLLGEIRPVFQLEKRIKEARKLGFKNLMTPKRHKMLWQVVKGLWRESK